MDSQTNLENKNNEDDSDLNSLLDDALGDFNRPIPPKKTTATGPPSTAPDSTNVWSDEFISAATKNFEATMKTIMNQQKESSEGDKSETQEEPSSALDMETMSAEFAKFAETAAKAATEASSDQDFVKCLSETMQQMTKNKEEAKTVPSPENLQKMFESFGIGENGNVDGNELGGFFPLVQTMLESILSKDILYPPLKEIVNKYPDWLADNRTKLSEEDYARYNKQYDLMKQVVEKFEKCSDEDSEEVKSKNSESVLILMQKLQDLGQPPLDLMGDYEGLMMNTDEKGNVQLPDLSSLLGGAGFPSLGLTSSTPGQPGGEGTQPAGAEGECALM